MIARPEDVDEVRALIARIDAPASRVILMPEGIAAETLDARGVWIAEICKEFGFRFSPRLHVNLWVNKRGV